MLNRTYATLKPNAPHTRVNTLVHALEAQGCTLPLQRSDQRLEFDVSDCNLWWLARGGLRRLLSSYGDIASWPGNFYDSSEASAQQPLSARITA